MRNQSGFVSDNVCIYVRVRNSTNEDEEEEKRIEFIRLESNCRTRHGSLIRNLVSLESANFDDIKLNSGVWNDL